MLQYRKPFAGSCNRRVAATLRPLLPLRPIWSHCLARTTKPLDAPAVKREAGDVVAEDQMVWTVGKVHDIDTGFISSLGFTIQAMREIIKKATEIVGRG